VECEKIDETLLMCKERVKPLGDGASTRRKGEAKKRGKNRLGLGGQRMSHARGRKDKKGKTTPLTF